MIVTREGREYVYRPRGRRLTLGLTGAGGLLAGVISTGIGEVTMSNLVRRVGMPVPATHAVQLVLEGGLDAIPWNLMVWAVPGAVTGAQIGSSLQGRVPERASNRFFALLFTGVGMAFLGTAARQAGI